MVDIRLGDCLELMKDIPDGSVDLVLTDIPYDAVNRQSNGLRNLDKGKADIITFDLDLFLREVLRVCKNSICIFCGKEQFSKIYEFFASQTGTVRPVIWEKSNPSPMNGQHIYLSGVEMAVWFKKSGAKTFNAHCKNTVFKYPNGRSKLHPTEKNHELLKELIFDNSNEGDVVFDPCMGSGSHGLVAVENNRNFIGIELDEGYFNIARKRIEEAQNEKKFGRRRISDMKAMLSQPMAGKTQEEIVATREKAIAALKEQGYEIVDTLFADEWYNSENMKKRGVVQVPLYFLAKSLENMSLCHAVYFCHGWEKARGCRIEHEAACAYGLTVIYEDGYNM